MSSEGVGAMSEDNNEKSALVPRLRFPEFRGKGGWTTVELGTVTTITTEKVGGNACIPMSITSGIGLVSQEEKFGRVIAGDSYKNYLLLKPNDFAYNKSATKEYSLFEPQQMLDENKEYFRKILHDFLNRYPFNPELFPAAAEVAPA